MTLRTVTFSSGFDHVVRVDNDEPGGVGRVLSWETFASGKGVNAARLAQSLGVPSVAYALVPEPDRDRFTHLIESTGPRAVTVAVPGKLRHNLTLKVETREGPATHAAGPRLSTATDAHAHTLMGQLLDETRPGDVVSFNGAVPPGVRPEVWAEVAVTVAGRGVVVVADAQDDALLALLNSGVVTMAKPNLDEAKALVPVRDACEEQVVRTAIDSMCWRGVRAPVVSVASRGVVHLDNGHLTRSTCEVQRPRMQVGAGDAFVAGYCAGLLDPRWRGYSAVEVALATAATHVAGDQVDVTAVGERARSIQHPTHRRQQLTPPSSWVAETDAGNLATGSATNGVAKPVRDVHRRLYTDSIELAKLAA